MPDVLPVAALVGAALIVVGAASTLATAARAARALPRPRYRV